MKVKQFPYSVGSRGTKNLLHFIRPERPNDVEIRSSLISQEQKSSRRIILAVLAVFAVLLLLLLLVGPLIIPMEPIDHPVNNAIDYPQADHSVQPPTPLNSGKEHTFERKSPTDLPKNYVPFPKYQVAYKIHEELATWDEARERCIAEGGDLAIIDSRDKIAAMKRIRSPHLWERLHVGIYKTNASDQWVRVDNGLAVTSVPWAYEKSKLTGSCAGISLFELGLVNYSCSGKREHFVCEIPITEGNPSIESSTKVDEGTPTPTSPTATLPEGYIKYSEDRVAYKIHAKFKSWIEARDICISEGARLPIPYSEQRMTRLNRLLGNADILIHVGIHRVENKWIRVDNGLPVPSFRLPQSFLFTAKNCCGSKTGIGGSKLYNYGCRDVRIQFVCDIPISDDDNNEQSTTEVKQQKIHEIHKNMRVQIVGI